MSVARSSHRGLDFARTGAALLTLLLQVTPCVARAAAGDAERAERLFAEGKEHLAQQDYAGACPLFAESYRLDAATGTLLALAICHERAGKLASAYREYNEVLARSKQEPREDRERAARERVTALAARISTLTLSVSEVSGAPGLELRVDGAVIDPQQAGKPIPVDGGEHVVEAWAPGKKTWRTTLVIAASIDPRTVIVPKLEAQAPEAPPPARRASVTARRATRTPRRAPESNAPTAVQWLGIAAIGAGVVGLGAGGYFTLRALNQNQKSNAGCEGDVCTKEGRRDRLDARRSGDVATIAFAAGGALAAAGFVLMIAGRADTESPRGVTAAPWIAPRAAGASLRGSF
jgi:hypothetical protein